MKLNGASKLRTALRRNATMQDVKDVVHSNSAEMTRNAQRLARTDTGFMKNNTLQFIEDNGMTGGVRSYAHYAIYNDLGTRFMSGNGFIKNPYEIQSAMFVREMEMLTK